jgi:hypothetical protein
MRRQQLVLALALAVSVTSCTPARHRSTSPATTSSRSSATRSSWAPLVNSQVPLVPSPTLAVSTPAIRSSPPVAVVSTTVRIVDQAHAGTSESRSARVSTGLGHTYVLSVLDDNGASAHPYGVTRLSLVTKTATQAHLDLDGSLTDPVFGSGALWLVRGIGARPEDFPHSLDLIRVDPITLKVSGSVHVGAANDVLAAANAVWIATNQSTLLRVDPATMKLTVARKFFTPLQALAFDGKHLWALQDPADAGTNSRLEDFRPLHFATDRRHHAALV